MNTIRIEILKPGLLTTIQDEGRPGMALFAVPPSGAADLQSLHLVNSLLGNPVNNPVLECTQMGISFKFHNPCLFAICGSDFGWTLDGQAIGTNKVIHTEAGAILDYGNKRTMARAYIAFGGKLRTTQSLGSFSTYTPFHLYRIHI